MSAIGTKRTFLLALHMSAFGGKADITPTCECTELSATWIENGDGVTVCWCEDTATFSQK